MRKCLLSSAALVGLLSAPATAADMPVKAPPAVVATVYNWTGLYIGVNAGYGWGRDKFRSVTEFNGGGPIIFNYGDFQYDTKGWLAGAQAGYNWLQGQYVFGVETDFQFSGIDGSRRFVASIFNDPSGTFHTDVSSELKYFGTARLRAGYLVTPQVLAYITGGFAYGRIESTLSFPSINGTPNPFTNTDRRWHIGGTAGAGLEGKLTDRITWKAEYLYVHLARKEHSFLIGNDRYTWQQSTDLHIARAGLNVLLSPAPVVARY